ncbi:calcium-binding protein [Streptomyces sp. NPDC006197]|uniref:calcium-binding protein n=1 Tax=Streptomyces sp. NPDC006197 TaxID=3156685 RepID=UPI0033B4236F
MSPGFALAAPGDLDTGFGAGGKATTNFGGFEQANAVAVQPDGKIIAAGFTDTGGVSGGVHDFALARYNADGSPDAGFDTDGRLTTDFSGFDQAAAVVVQADGKIIAAGHANSGDFALARYNANGSLDTGFGTGGKVTTDFGGTDQARGMALQADGKIVVAGASNAGGTYDFALARYNANGSLDTGFDTDGKVTTGFGGLDQAFAVAVQPDGRIVATGKADPGGNDDFALARYNADGSPDTGFGTGGRVTTDFFGGLDQARGMALQADGKIVAAGLANAGGVFDFALARYNADGTPDAGFDADGRATTDFSGGNDTAASVAVQADGKIIVVGQSTPGDFALARYNPDGTPDTGFDADGRVTTDFFGANDGANAVALQADGKIVAAGHASSTTTDFAVARYQNGGATPPQQPSLTIGKSHTGTFTRGQRGEYTITVGNNGTAPTNGTPVTVQDTLPTGLSAGRLVGPGWSCTRSTLTCTRSDVLAPGSSYPPITLRVRVARNAPDTVTNSATVTGGGDTAPHTATDPTTVVPRRPSLREQ